MAVMKKDSRNPIITTDNVPCDCVYVSNPGCIKIGDEYVMIANVTLETGPIVFWVARSSNGVDFVFEDKPVQWPLPPASWPEDCVYDARITELDGVYYLVHCSSCSKMGERVGIVKTTDFVTFERVGVVSELGNRNGVLFPEKINGLYARLDRPFGNEMNPCDMWVSYSPDLKFWGNSEPVLSRRPGYWDRQKIGAGAVPIRIKEGWLTIYHGVGETCNGFIYALGAAILDYENPAKVIARTEDAILYPKHDYEILGRVSNVVFACNAIVGDDGDSINVYYGAADSQIGLATTSISELTKACYTKNKYSLKCN